MSSCFDPSADANPKPVCKVCVIKGKFGCVSVGLRLGEDGVNLWVKYLADNVSHPWLCMFILSITMNTTVSFVVLSIHVFFFKYYYFYLFVVLEIWGLHQTKPESTIEECIQILEKYRQERFANHADKETVEILLAGWDGDEVC